MFPVLQLFLYFLNSARKGMTNFDLQIKKKERTRPIKLKSLFRQVTVYFFVT